MLPEDFFTLADFIVNLTFQMSPSFRPPQLRPRKLQIRLRIVQTKFSGKLLQVERKLDLFSSDESTELPSTAIASPEVAAPAQDSPN